MVFDSSRGSTRVCRDARVAPTESDSSPRHDDESHMGGVARTRPRLVGLVGLCRTKMCHGGRDATLVRLVPFAKGKAPDSCDS